MNYFKNKNLVKYYILLTISLYIPFYHISKTTFEAATALLLPLLISNYKESRNHKEFLAFIIVIALYIFTFAIAYMLKNSNMDLVYTINFIRMAIPLAVIYFATYSSSSISINDLIFSLSISLIMTFIMIISPWYKSDFSGRITLGTNLLLIYGTILSATIVLVFTALLTQKGSSRKAFLFSTIAFILGTLSLIASNAKGAILATITMLIMVSCTQIKSIRSLFMFIIFITIIIFSIYSHPKTNFTLTNAYQQIDNYFSSKGTATSHSQGHRLEMWRGATIKISESPLTMSGNMKLSDSFQQEIKKGVISNNIGHFKHVHNDYLQSWMSRGPVGFISLLLIIITPIAIIKNKTLKFMTFSFIGVYGLTSITSVPFLHIYSLRYYCLVVIILLIIDKQLRDKEKDIFENWKSIRTASIF